MSYSMSNALLLYKTFIITSISTHFSHSNTAELARNKLEISVLFVISASGRICLFAVCVKVTSSESVLNITLFAIYYFSPIKSVVRYVKFCLPR